MADPRSQLPDPRAALPDPRAGALVVAAAQLVRGAEPCVQTEDDGDREAYLVSADDLARLERALAALAGER